MNTEVISYHLQMCGPNALRPAATINPLFEVEQIQGITPDFNRFLYHAVGEQWSWHARLDWSPAEWETFLARSTVQTWAGTINSTPVGYFELEQHPDQSVELAYFGLLAQFIGQGLGGVLLTEAVRCAWALGAKSIWLHTCSTDHPHALPNYLARGFQIVKEERQSATVSVILLE